MNRDEKVDIIGGEKGSGGVAMPAGLWEISTKAGANSENRYVINNANQGNGAHSTEDSNTVSVHATSTWILGLEKGEGEAWDSLDITNNPTFNLDKDREWFWKTNISGGGTTIEAIRTSDLGYGENNEIQSRRW